MENFAKFLGCTFCIIWIILSILSWAMAIEEKKMYKEKDDSWKIFGAVFVFCLMNAIMYGFLTYLFINGLLFIYRSESERFF